MSVVCHVGTNYFVNKVECMYKSVYVFSTVFIILNIAYNLTVLNNIYVYENCTCIDVLST